MCRLYEKMPLPAELEIIPDYTKKKSCCFGIVDGVRYIWTGCRETCTNRLSLRYKALKYTHLYISPQPSDSYYCFLGQYSALPTLIENLIRLFHEIEVKMNWEMEHTRIHPTKDSNIYYVHLSPGWFQNFNSISLATLFLRIGPNYFPEISLSTLLRRQDHSVITAIAIERFLDGYQYYRGTCDRGWAESFKNRSSIECEALLMKSSEVHNYARKLAELDGYRYKESEYFLRACNHFIV